MENLDIETVTVTTWDEVIKVLKGIPPRWVFRGQASSEWSLKSSLERVVEGWIPNLQEAIGGALEPSSQMLDDMMGTTSGNKVDPQDYNERFVPAFLGRSVDMVRHVEEQALYRFRSQAHQYLSAEQIPTNLLEWFALMQHHGAPTRLVDWTHSPYIAAYFAMENASEMCSVWCIDTPWFVDRAVERFRESVDENSPFRDLDTAVPDSILFEQVVRCRLKGVFPVIPDLANRRLGVQQGLFVALGDTRTDFMGNVSSYGETSADHVVKVDIPKSVRAEALEDLHRMNIDRSTLFPGIDGFAQSIQYQLKLQGDTDWLKSVIGRVTADPRAFRSVMGQAVNSMIRAPEKAGAALELLQDMKLITPHDREQIVTELKSLGTEQKP